MTTTFQTKEGAQADRKWFVVDAADQPLGRLASRIAPVLRGKHKPSYTPHVDGGDFVVVINAEKVKLTGNKLEQKMYHRHTGYVGSVKSENAETLLERKPELMIEKAVKGMLPRTTLGKQLLSKLKVYPGAEHPHFAQQPEVLN